MRCVGSSHQRSSDVSSQRNLTYSLGNGRDSLKPSFLLRKAAPVTTRPSSKTPEGPTLQLVQASVSNPLPPTYCIPRYGLALIHIQNVPYLSSPDWPRPFIRSFRRSGSHVSMNILAFPCVSALRVRISPCSLRSSLLNPVNLKIFQMRFIFRLARVLPPLSP